MTTTGDAPGPHAPWLFLFATLAWSWSFWAIAVAAGGMDGGALGPLSYAAGGFGPAIVASWLVRRGRADESLSGFWRRALDPRRVSARVWVAVLLLAVLPPLTVRLLVHGIDGATIELGAAGFLLVGAIAGLAEEPGWRGYAQEGLQRRMPVIAAAWVTGIFWAGWHLPLFWMAGTWQHGQGAGTRAFWIFHLAILVDTVLYGWLYNLAGRVTVAVVAYHALGNVAGELFPADDAGRLHLMVSMLVTTGVVASAWHTMTRSRSG